MPVDSSGTQKRETRTKRRTVIAFLAVTFLAIVLVGPVIATSQPGFYEQQKPLREYVRQWRNSTHQKMPCTDCHIEPGLGQLVLFAARSVPAFYSQLILRREKTNLFKIPTKFACRKCHTTYRKTSPSGDLLIPHQAHVEILKLNCPDCHQKLVHWPSPPGLNRPPMTYCLSQCHDGKTAQNLCLSCHIEKAPPPSHLVGNWLEIHNQKTKEEKCGACHGWALELCEACHSKKPRTHVGNWKKLHQDRARLIGGGCLFCHPGREKWCLRCHDTGLFEKSIFQISAE